MADLVVDAARVGLTQPAQAEVYTMECAEVTAAGQVLYLVIATGRVGVADANVAGKQQARFLSLESGGPGRRGISVLKRGHVAGFTIPQAYDAPIYLSDTPGAFADAPGTLSVVVGRVTSIADSGGGNAPTKCIYFDFPWNGTYA